MQIEAEKAAEAARRQKEQELAREREVEDLRRRERTDRGRGEGAVVVVAETTTGKALETPDPRLPGIGAVTDTVNLRPGGTSILMSHPALAEVADPPNPLPTHALLRGPSLGRLRPVDKAVEVGIDLLTAVAVPTADQCPPIDGIVESQGDAVRITVIELDPIPAVIHHAHVLPGETETDGGLSPVA